MSIEYYKNGLSKLRSDVKPYWPASTFHHAPYKSLLLLAVMDLIAQDVIDSNFIKLNADLIDAFDLYWTRIVGNERESNPVMPFNHLRSQGFWHLVDIEGFEQDLQNTDRNEIFRRIKNQELYAKLDDELFALLQESESRDELRSVLIEEFFTPETRPIIAEVGRITAESFEYSRELLNRSRGRFSLRESPSMDEMYLSEARSTAFRKVIVDAYRHTCAFCRIRLLTPEGRTAVAAAHIIPWSHSHNDDPRNGIALCGLHHWAFDQGLMTVTTEYQIRVSQIVTVVRDGAEPILLLEGTDMYRPIDRLLWPAHEALRWHVNNVFRPEAPNRPL